MNSKWSTSVTTTNVNSHELRLLTSDDAANVTTVLNTHYNIMKFAHVEIVEMWQKRDWCPCMCLSASYSAVTVCKCSELGSLAFPFRTHKSFVFTVRFWWGLFDTPQCIVNAFGERICGSNKPSLILSISVWDAPQFDPFANLGQNTVCIIISLCWR